MNEMNKPGTAKRRLLSLIAAGLAGLMLSSCASTYTARLDGGDGTGEWIPPVDGLVSPDGGDNTRNPISDLIGDLGDFDASHLFSGTTFDPSSLAGFAGLAGMGDMVEKLKDFSGFTQDDAYFIADFDSNPSKYSGAGKFLFAKDKVFSEEERRELVKGLSADQVILAAYQADEQGQAVELYTVYPADKEIRQIYIARPNPQTKEPEMLLYSYVTTPIDGNLPTLPGEEIPDRGEYEKGKRYSDKWLEWLIYEDRGTVYPMVEEGTLYLSRYENDTYYTASPWSIRQEGIVARFALSLGLSAEEFPYVDVEGDQYVWKVFYRPLMADQTMQAENFSCTTDAHPWKSSYQAGYGYHRMELDLFNYGMEMYLQKDGSNRRYETVFLIEDMQGRILCWYSDYVDWTDSSEKYYEQAVDAGIQVDHRENAPSLENKEPANVNSSDWLEWLVKKNGADRYRNLQGELINNVFATDKDPSVFGIWPYDAVSGSVTSASRFCLALSLDRSTFNFTEGIGQSNYAYTWSFGYREMGEESFTFQEAQRKCVPYGYAVYGSDAVYYLDVINYGMMPHLRENGSGVAYEMVFVIRENGNVVGWQRFVVEWNEAAQAYYEEAVKLGIQKNVLSSPEPEERYSPSWIKWLLEEDQERVYSRVTEPYCKSVADGHTSSQFYNQDAYMEMELSYSGVTPGSDRQIDMFFKAFNTVGVYQRLKIQKQSFKGEITGGKWRETATLSFDPKSLLFMTNFGAARSYELLYVVREGEKIVGWGLLVTAWNSTSDRFLQKAMEVAYPTVEPTMKYNEQWVRWLKGEGNKKIPSLFQFEMAKYPTKDGNTTPFHIRKDLTSDLFVLEFSVAKLPYEGMLLLFRNVTQGQDFYQLVCSKFECEIVGGRTVYRLPIDPVSCVFSMKDGKEQTYELVFLPFKTADVSKGSAVGWASATISWGEAEEALKAEAIEKSAFAAIYNNSLASPPAGRYTSVWAEWLTKADQTFSGSIRDMEKLSIITARGVKFNEALGYSSFHVYHYREGNPPTSDAFFCLAMTSVAEVDLTEGLKNGTHPYKWRLYYREQGSAAPYRMITVQPSSKSVANSMLFLDLSEYKGFLFPEEGERGTYEILLVISDRENDIPMYYSLTTVDWSSAGEAFYQFGVQYGLLPKRDD